MPAQACQAAREDLISCLLRTDCVLKSGKTPTECLKHQEELPLQCQHLIARFADCKKGMLDMRRRFRGNHLSDEAKDRARGSVLTAGAVDFVPDRYPDEKPAQAR